MALWEHSVFDAIFCNFSLEEDASSTSAINHTIFQVLEYMVTFTPELIQQVYSAFKSHFLSIVRFYLQSCHSLDQQDSVISFKQISLFMKSFLNLIQDKSFVDEFFTHLELEKLFESGNSEFQLTIIESITSMLNL